MKKGWLVYGIVIALVVLIGGALLYFFINKPQSTTDTAAPSTNTSTSSSSSDQSSSSTAQSATVSIANMAFSPVTITIKQGDTVTWTNNDSTAHTVTSNNGSFDSGSLSKGKTFAHTFDTAGTFEYHCTFHPSMKGTVVVQ